MGKKNSKQPSNPFSTGSGGAHFEALVQGAFVALMLTGGFAPCMPAWPINKIKLQGRFAGYETDDLIVFIEEPSKNQKCKILCQIKHSIGVTENDDIFSDVIQAAWNDFNNTNLFSKGKDAIALITGPLSATDINDVRPILEWARHLENADEFIEMVEKTHISSQRKRSKLQAFRTNLQKANSGIPISNNDLFEFLKHFHLLGYDLDIKAGVTLSLLHSLIGQYSQENAASLWTRLINEVQFYNQNAGTITLESLSEELREAFTQRTYAVIPNKFSAIQISSETPDLNQLPYASELAIVNLVGSWNEQNEADMKVIKQLINKDLETWLSNIREILHQPASPLVLRNGRWHITERKKLWDSLGARIFDKDLENFKTCAINVLTERDPQFDLPIEQRFAASVYGKALKSSPDLRKGIAESLAILGNRSNSLINCSLTKPESITIITIQKIFDGADWVLWASLNDLLPLLAEATPNEFLSIVEHTLQQSPCPFDELFPKEGSSLTGRNYITGLLWALETLAWDEEFLVRVCVILGELTSRDPGGTNWANRPSNSLRTILLPWFPQTMASIEKRKVAMQTLQKENPEVAWNLLLTLLPNQHQTTSGSRKPLWQNAIPDDWGKNISNQEYWEQVMFYAEIVVSIATDDIDKLNEIVSDLDNLPKPSFDKLLELLSSEDIYSKPEHKRSALWVSLTEFAAKHKRFSDANWALAPEIVSKIENIIAKLAPTDPLKLHHKLFSNNDFALYEENDNWEEQSRKLGERRKLALIEILDKGGISAIIQFAQVVEAPSSVGYTLGTKGNPEIDNILLPAFLDTENKNFAQLAGGYVWSSQLNRGWSWADGLDKTNWSITQTSQFLCYLPITGETWERVASWLGNSEREYWIKVNVNPFGSHGDLYVAIDKLADFGRPSAAINCLYKIYYEKQPVDKIRTIKALLAAVSAKESLHTMDTYHIIELIKALQNDSETNSDDLFRVEWAYLPLLDHHRGASPKLLENRLASDSAFFCEVIRLVYRSKKENKSRTEPSNSQESVATNAWTLLHEWKTPPGTQFGNTFSGEKFTEWLDKVKEFCTESGHLEVALTHIGQVSIYCPADSQGLWINKSVAETLNAKDADQMRLGFRLELFNSRGFHSVDPTGKPERELAKQYRQKAEDIENAGYQRFAATLRDLAEDYDREADRNISDHNDEQNYGMY